MTRSSLRLLCLVLALPACSSSGGAHAPSGTAPDAGGPQDSATPDGSGFDGASTTSDSGQDSSTGGPAGPDGSGATDAGDAGSLAGPLLGMYEQGSLTREAAVQSWLGKTIMLSLDGASTASWSGLSDPTWLDPADGWPAWQSSVPGRHLLITVDMLPTPPEGGTVSLAECASHDYDSHWITLAQNLVAWNLGDAILRLGHEFNGNWYPWAAFVPPSTPAQYAGCFQSMVTAMRGVAGQQFTFNWNASLGQDNDVSLAYPGDTYVDSIGVDAYDVSYTFYGTTTQATPTEQASAWAVILDAKATQYGLTYFANFARQHGKPLTFPEWGVWNTSAGHGGGDDPAFIQNMHDFIFDPANGVAWHDYFNVHSTDGYDHELYSPGDTTEFPRSAAKFLALFGAPDGG